MSIVRQERRWLLCGKLPVQFLLAVWKKVENGVISVEPNKRQQVWAATGEACPDSCCPNQRRRPPGGVPRGRRNWSPVRFSYPVVVVETGGSRTPRPRDSLRDMLQACPAYFFSSPSLPPAGSKETSRIDLRPLLYRRRFRQHPDFVAPSTPPRGRGVWTGCLVRQPVRVRARQLLFLPPVLRGVTAPRLAIPQGYPLSNPRVPIQIYYTASVHGSSSPAGLIPWSF